MTKRIVLEPERQKQGCGTCAYYLLINDSKEESRPGLKTRVDIVRGPLKAVFLRSMKQRIKFNCYDFMSFYPLRMRGYLRRFSLSAVVVTICREFTIVVSSIGIDWNAM